MHDYLAAIAPEFVPAGVPPGQPPRTEIPIGDVIQAAICRGMPVEAECFTQGSYLDIGTPADLFRAVQQFTLTSF